MSAEQFESGPQKGKNYAALERLLERDLSPETVELVLALETLADSPSSVMNMSAEETPSKLDRLFTYANEKYNVTPNSLRFVSESATAEDLIAIRNKLKDYAYIKGRTPETIRTEFEMVDEIARMLAKLEQEEYSEAA